MSYLKAWFKNGAELLLLLFPPNEEEPNYPWPVPKPDYG